MTEQVANEKKEENAKAWKKHLYGEDSDVEMADSDFEYDFMKDKRDPEKLTKWQQEFKWDNQVILANQEIF